MPWLLSLAHSNAAPIHVVRKQWGKEFGKEFSICEWFWFQISPIKYAVYCIVSHSQEQLSTWKLHLYKTKLLSALTMLGAMNTVTILCVMPESNDNFLAH